MSSGRSRNWCFTLNNPQEQETSHLLSLKESGPENSRIKGLIIGEETGDSGTFHYQGFLMLKNPATMSSVKSFLGSSRLHLERMMGTPIQAWVYCEKEKVFLVIGEKPAGQGARSDLLAIQQLIRDGTSEQTIADEYFGQWIVYGRRFEAYRNLISQNEVRHAPEVIVLWGPTGTGKTRRVHEALGTLWSWPGGQWFDGYRNQDNALFDDFDGEIPFRLLLRLLDRYRLQVPIKGGFVWWNPKTIWITSNKHPDDWYPLEDISPLMRRISRIELIRA